MTKQKHEPSVINMPSKYSREYLLKLFQYTLGEDIANAVTHIVGGFFAIYALINLSWISGRYGNWLDALSFIFYGLTILFMFLMSSLYHSMINHTARSVFKKMDHIAIYVLILGSYTPFTFSLLQSRHAYIIYLIIAISAICGILFKSFHAGKFKKMSTLLYVTMGWLGLLLLPEIMHKLTTLGLYFFVAGGAMYTIGALLYALAKFRYAHMIWHIFVIFGVVFQYITIAFYITMP